MTAAPFYRLETDAPGSLRLRGTISFTNAAQAYASPPLAPKRGGALDINLAGLENADSATLAVLIAWGAQARRNNTALRYLEVPQGLRNLAKLADVDRLLDLA